MNEADEVAEIMIFSKKNPDTPNAVSSMPEAIMERMPAGFCYAGADGEFAVSPTFLSLLGITRPPAHMDGLMESLMPAVAEKIQAWLLGLNAQQPYKILNIEIPPHAASASARIIEISGHVLDASAANQAVSWVLWAYDATESKRELFRLQQENSKLKYDVKQYSTILNMAPYPIWERGSDLQIRYGNLCYSEMVEDITPRAEGMALPDIDKKARQLAANALAEAAAQRDRRHIVVSGARRFYQLDELPIPEQQLTIGFGQDISEIEALHEELKRYMSAQSDLLESSASAMAIYGPDMRLKSFNYAFVALWKLDEAWLESEPTYGEVLELLREHRKLPEQANFQMFKQQQIRMFTELIEPREEFFYLPDGKTLRVIAITHALGGILFAYEDVTDRLALERSYNTLIAVQRETLDHLHEGVVVFGENGRLRLCNPVYLAMWDIPPEFVASNPHIRDIIDYIRDHYSCEDDWEAFREHRVAQIQSRETQKYHIERRDGKVIDCSVVPLPDGATLINFIDVTDTTLVERSLREKNEALQDADRVKTEFLANVSYELRSPLTSIAGFSDMLRQEYFGSLTDKQREYVDGIYQSSQHLMDLVNDILDLASIEAGFMQLEKHEFEIQKMLESAIGLVNERARRQELTLTLQCEAGIGRMMGDETRIKQCLLNLLSNAVRFGETGGTVVLAAEAKQEEIYCYVEDNGPGIPSHELPHIFNKFYKGKNDAIPKAKSKAGTGLGLSMVKNFIELHGGRVEVASTQGCTRFTCILPRGMIAA